MKTLFALLSMWGIVQMGAGLYKVLHEEWDNKFIEHHQAIADLTGLSSCWLCTHSPISAKTMAYVAIPLTKSEIYSLTQGPISFMANNPYKGNRSSLTIVQWVTPPWLIYNRTGKGKPLGKTPVENGTAFVLSCFPSQQNCSCMRVKRPTKTSNPTFLDSLNYTTCQGNKSTSRSCIGIDATRGTTWCMNQTISWLLWNMQRAISGNLTEVDNSTINEVTSQIQVVKSINTLFNQTGSPLPPGVYFVCGRKAYKWLVPKDWGECTLAKLEPATWVWEDSDFPIRQAPQHMLYKRDTQAKHLIHTPWYKKFGLSLTLVGLSIVNAKHIEKLADLFDNITAIMFRDLNITSTLTAQLILVTNQHTVVLDYLTAAQGGMCQIVGPACCHYIDDSGTVLVQHDLERAKKLKEDFRKENSEDDWNLNWPSWLSWLNPANWFTGVGGWLSGVLHAGAQILMIGLVLYIVFKLIILLIGKCCVKRKKSLKVSGKESRLY